MSQTNAYRILMGKILRLQADWNQTNIRYTIEVVTRN